MSCHYQQAQYGFIHDAVLEALTCGNTQIPVQNLRTAIAKLSKKDAMSGKTGFERHFEVSKVCYIETVIVCCDIVLTLGVTNNRSTNGQATL